MNTETSTDMVSVELPRELVERVAFLMEPLDIDQDYWNMYWACLKALANRNE
jgi:hypothetical protein